MITRQKQIQNLRKYIVEEIENVGLKRTFINNLRRNNQSVTGNLVNSILAINYQRSGRFLRITSSFDKQNNILQDISVNVEIPWGEYGIKLDTVQGRASRARGGRMSPPKEKILSWMDAKGLFKGTFYRQTRRLKSGATRTYIYPAKRDSYRKSIAFRIAKKINEENELKTRNAYSTDLGIKLEFAVLTAFKRFNEEFALDYLNDFALSFDRGNNR